MTTKNDSLMFGLMAGSLSVLIVVAILLGALQAEDSDLDKLCAYALGPEFKYDGPNEACKSKTITGQLVEAYYFDDLPEPKEQARQQWPQRGTKQ